MKNLVCLVAFSAVFASAAVAQSPKAPKAKTISCAVMKGDMVDVAKATKDKSFQDYKGRRYFFCCAGCAPKFESDPAKYAKTAPSIPTPKKA